MLSLCKTKRYIKKWKNINLKTFVLEIVKCYLFDDLIKLEDFGLDNVLIEQNSHEKNLICYISYKNLIDPNPLQIRFFKIDGIITIYDGTRSLTLFGSEK